MIRQAVTRPVGQGAPGSAFPRKRFCRIIVLLPILLTPLGLLGTASPASSQQTVTLTGAVVDITSGAPIPAALVTVGIPGRQAISDAQGRFRIEGLPAVTQFIHVQRFGYRSLEQNVTLSPGMPLLQLPLEPDPIQLQQLTVTGNARADVTGVVWNAVSGEPIPFTDLTLTRDSKEQVGRKEATDDRGEFKISSIGAGAYLLLVERIGFVSQYVAVSHSVPPQPVEVRMDPDSALVRGLAFMNDELRTRRAAHSGASRVYDEQALRFAPPTGMKQFLDGFTPLKVVECGNPRRRTCILLAGKESRPVVFIDGVRVPDVPPPPRNSVAPPPSSARGRTPATVTDPAPVALEDLDTFDPHDFYSVEYFECDGKWRDVPSAAASGNRTVDPYVEIHAYTYAYMERLGRRPRIPMPSCVPW